MTEVTIYHNPKCSKSRQALQLLRERGIEPKIVEYIKQPLNVTQIKRLLRLLEMSPRELMRKKESDYRALNLADPNLKPDILIHALVDHPALMERPIVVVGDRAVVGRPPESVLDILQPKLKVEIPVVLSSTSNFVLNSIQRIFPPQALGSCPLIGKDGGSTIIGLSRISYPIDADGRLKQLSSKKMALSLDSAVIRRGKDIARTLQSG